MKHNTAWLVFILVLTAFCLWVALPATTKGVEPDNPVCVDYARDHTVDTGGVRCSESIMLDLNSDGESDFNLNIQQSLGLDLVGGLRVLLQADLPAGSFTAEDLKETANNVERRVNGLGLTEATVQVQGSNRILVELPGVRDRQQAINAVQQTALLEFVDFGGLANQAQRYEGQKILTTEQVRLNSLRDEANTDTGTTPEGTAEATDATPTTEATAAATSEATAEATQAVAAEATTEPASTDAPAEEEAPRLTHPTTGQPFQTVFTGAQLQAASARYGATGSVATASWFIEFEMKPEFADDFASYTASRIGEPMAIVLDGTVLSAPTIQSQLPGKGIITGRFTEKEATTLALQLRSGALPIPLSVISAEEVGATLGQESVALSIRAGVIGVIMVFIFMLVYYRAAGISADLALAVFIALNFAIFKLIPVTLTLPAITGFLISIGTAVDGNILIFERIKEELRGGKSLRDALPLGFDRAWASIRDSNLSTIIICGILFLFGQTPGASIVSGFAVTLALGLLVNLFTAVLVTRTFMFLIDKLAHNYIAARPWLMGV